MPPTANSVFVTLFALKVAHLYWPRDASTCAWRCKLRTLRGKAKKTDFRSIPKTHAASFDFTCNIRTYHWLIYVLTLTQFLGHRLIDSSISEFSFQVLAAFIHSWPVMENSGPGAADASGMVGFIADFQVKFLYDEICAGHPDDRDFLVLSAMQIEAALIPICLHYKSTWIMLPFPVVLVLNST